MTGRNSRLCYAMQALDVFFVRLFYAGCEVHLERHPCVWWLEWENVDSRGCWGPWFSQMKAGIQR